MRRDNFDGYMPMLNTGTVQDSDPAFHAANGCTAHTCDVVAGERDAEGRLKDGARGKEKEDHDSREGTDLGGSNSLKNGSILELCLER